MKSEDLDFIHEPLHKYTDKESLAPIAVSMRNGKFPFYGLKIGSIEMKPVPKWIGDVQHGETST